jgi:phenylalanyl-tRNA synthetase beta chain
MKVPVAVVWAKLSESFVIAKTKIRWEISEWMICSEDELWLVEERQKWILELPKDAPIWVSMKDYLWKNEVVLEVDNKAINHRPDLFSHVGILREVYAINWEKFNFNYEDRDFSKLNSLWIKNEIPKVVKRYIWLKVTGIQNIETPEHIKEILEASDCSSKWLLVDLSNYSLYFYGQPTHIFDADKIEGNIVIRNAKPWEKTIALDDKEYELTNEDIVIADQKKVIAIAWIIWSKNSCVDLNTKNIIIESANFNHATLRMSGKRLWLRTDALNVFEKDLLPISAKWWVSLIVSELEKAFTNINLDSYSDCYTEEEKVKTIDYDLDFINNLIWKKYEAKKVSAILDRLWIIKEENKLIVPNWRKELNYKADIAEEVARIDWYSNINSQIPKIELGAIIQNNTYKTKVLSRNFFVSEGFYDMYTYSFVNDKLMQKCNSTLEWLVPLKNFLSEDATHMKNSLIPNLLLSIEKNKVDFKDLKIFEVEKVFNYKENLNSITENYNISWVVTNTSDIAYYNIQNIVSKFLKEIWVSKYEFKTTSNIPKYAHKTRTAEIVARWQCIGTIWEIKPIVVKNFSLKSRLWFFEINLDKLKDMIHTITKVSELSDFQSSSFDISFLIDKNLEWLKLKNIIAKTNIKVIEKVEVFDIYENEEKLKWNRSISFKVFLQKMDSEINDKEKNELIEEIIKKATKFWALHK